MRHLVRWDESASDRNDKSVRREFEFRDVDDAPSARIISNGSRFAPGWTRGRGSAPQFVTRWRVSECPWMGRDCSENTRDFPLTRGVWLSDISYIQTEDLEDPDEGEYLMHVRARIFYEDDRAVARARRRSEPRLLRVASARFHAWRPSWQRTRRLSKRLEMRVMRRVARVTVAMRRDSNAAAPAWILRLGSRCATAAAARDRVCRGRREYFGRCEMGWVSHGWLLPYARLWCAAVARGEQRVSRNHGAVLSVERGRHAI